MTAHAAPHRTVALLSILSLAALSLLVAAGVTAELDLVTLRALQGVASEPLDLAANLHTLLGLAIPTTLAACALCVALFRRGHGAASLAPLLIVATAAVELALKLTTGHAPPGPELDRAFIEPFGPRVETPSGFPSGHAARLTFLSLLVALLAERRWVWIAAATFVAFTLWARVYIGDHWPTDVLGGFAIGTACAVIAAAWIRRLR